MALDHYISQVHLRQFHAPDLGELLYAYRKSDLLTFTPHARDVCRIEQGSTNPYLQEPRAVEEFLKNIEPFYNQAIQQLHNDNLDGEGIYALAGFVAYVLTCSPGAMRLHSLPMKGILEDTARTLDSQGVFPPPPEGSSIGSVTELLDQGEIELTVDPKFPQSIGIRNLIRMVQVYGNSRWEFLQNPYPDNPFFTSDFPVVAELTPMPQALNRVVPLSPSIATRIYPNIEYKGEGDEIEFGQFKHRYRKVSLREVRLINRSIIRCAEDLVFSTHNRPWVTHVVSRNAKYKLVPTLRTVPHGNGTLQISRLAIQECE